MNLSLQDKTALICGSTQGIGFATAEALAKLGAHCILMSRNETALQQAVQLLDTTNGQQHQYLVADFNHPETVKASIHQFLATQQVQILINNSGGPSAGPIIDASEENFIQTFNRHVICNQILTQAVVPGMKAAAYGRIINIISTSVKVPLPNLGVSNTIRGAVAAWAKSMANELGQFNITVNNVLPGYTVTNRLHSLILANAAAKGITTEQLATDMINDIPMKRFGTADELANVIAFLASPAASYVNGTSIPVDGGRTGSI
jgi:3-oxoacyl-[acyl-carrier protein] reductase